MQEGRNTQGQFAKGHPGFKPKGAISRKKQSLEYRLNQVFAMLEKNMAENLHALKPHQQVKLWVDLTKMVVPKLKRIAYNPDPPEKQVTKVTFKVVRSAAPKPAESSKTVNNQRLFNS